MCADLVITSVGQFDVKLANVRRQKMLLWKLRGLKAKVCES
jgi:hypothetical protein